MCSYRAHPSKKGWYYVEYRPNGYKGTLERIPVEGIEKAISLDNDLKGKRHHHAELHPKLKDVVDQYLVWVKANLSADTYKNKTNRLKRYIIPYFGNFRVRDLNQSILDTYSYQHKRTVYRVDLAHLMALCKWMHRRNLAPLLSFDPESVSSPAQVKTIPAPQDLLRMLEAVPSEQARRIFTLILFTGLRWSEAAKLRWECVDLSAGALRIAEAEHDRTDIVPIPPILMEWFKDNHKSEGWVFPGRKKGEHIKRLDRTLNKGASKIGLKGINPHLLRHASATLLYQATGDIYAVQHHLRHAKVSTSQIYTRFSVEQKQRSVDALVQHITASEE